MEIFYQCYGAEAGLAGLKWLPYGGLYLTGECMPPVKFQDVLLTQYHR